MTTSWSMFLLILGCAIVTWIPRIVPFAIVKNMKIPGVFMRFLSYIPVCVLTALVVDSLINEDSFLRLDFQNIIAFIPTIAVAIWTKSLSFTVIVGVITMAILRIL